MRLPEIFLDLLRNGLIEAQVDETSPLVVAVSGGPDSTALLLGIEELKARSVISARLIVAHFNHGLRGLASKGDVRFVSDLCKSNSIECISGTGDTPVYADSNGLSPEAASRELRYDFLAHVVQEKRAQGVVIGHTMDDQAETLLINAVRGTGIRGIRGMRPNSNREPRKNGVPPLRLIRPMLRIRRSETAQFCRELEIRPRLDASNKDLTIPRNRIRSRVLPELEAINPEAVPAFARLADLIALDVSIIDRQIHRVWNEICNWVGEKSITLNRAALCKLEPAILHQLLRAAFIAVSDTPNGITYAHIDQMAVLALGRTGTQMNLPHGLRLHVGREQLFISSGPDGGILADCPFPRPFRPVDLVIPGRTSIGGNCAIETAETRLPPDFTAESPWVTYLGQESITSGLLVRTKAKGDRFQPLGMRAEKKLKDFFIDQHIPQPWRSRIPIVECKQGIAWVVGYRPADWTKIRSGTERVIRLAYINNSRKPLGQAQLKF